MILWEHWYVHLNSTWSPKGPEWLILSSFLTPLGCQTPCLRIGPGYKHPCMCVLYVCKEPGHEYSAILPVFVSRGVGLSQRDWISIGCCHVETQAHADGCQQVCPPACNWMDVLSVEFTGPGLEVSLALMQGNSMYLVLMAQSQLLGRLLPGGLPEGPLSHSQGEKCASLFN